ncbi:MAG: 4-aminobutyrate--2-oxoglutarate transaminase [Bacillota bacterium]
MIEKTINLRTDIPGPISRQMLVQREENVCRGVSNLVPFLIKEGEGALVKDMDDNVFIDFSSGISTVNTGHNHPEIVSAVKEQADKFFHTCFMVVMYESYIHLAKRLNQLAPGDHHKKTAFFNSGAEAVENAVKVARRYTKKNGIISLECAFHGRTLLTMTLTSKVRPYKFGYGPFAPEVYKMPAPYCYRCKFGLNYPQCGLACAYYLEKFFTLESPAENIAALIVEPVLGEGGFIVPPDGYLQALRQLCAKYNILLIADEIQTGFGRTGTFFAVEHSLITPDLITIGKSLAAGIPLSGLIGRADIMDTPDPGEIGGTFSGNPLGCAAAHKVIDIIERDNLSQRARGIGDKVMARLNNMAEKYLIIGDVRGLGAMVAMELVKDRATKEPAAAETKAIIQECYKNGLITLSAGIFNNVIRLLMPLVISDNQLQTGLDVLESALAKVNEQHHD